MAAVATARHGAPSLLALGPDLALPSFPVVSLLAALPALAADLIPDVGDWHAALLLGPLLHVWAGLMLYRLCRLRAPRGAALVATLAWAMASPALLAARAPGGALPALSLLGVLWAIARLRLAFDPRALLSGSLWLALLVLVQPSLVLAALLLALGLAHAARGTVAADESGDTRQALAFLAWGPLVAALLLGVGYRWQVTGRPGWPLDSLMVAVPWPLPWLAIAGVLVLVGLLLSIGEEGYDPVFLAIVGVLSVALAGWNGALTALPLATLLAVRVARGPMGMRILAGTVVVVLAGFILPLAFPVDAPPWVSPLAAARLQALRLAVGLGGAFAGLAVWLRQRGAMVLAAGGMIVLVGTWLWLGDLHRFQPTSVQEVVALLPATPPAGAELWYGDPALAEPLMALTSSNWRLVAMPPEALSDERLVARAEGLRQRRAPLFLLLPRRDLPAPLDQRLTDSFARARESGTPIYRLIELWPFQ